MDRRAFLGTAALGSGLLAELSAARAAFGERLAPVREAGADPQRLRREYSLAPGVRYFNHGSIGTIPRAVQDARRDYLALCESNPWLYMFGDAWEEPREAVRAKAASLLGCHPRELAITHNTTEGFNLLASGLPLGAGDEVLFSSLNHPGASLCFEHQAARRGYSVRRFELPLASIPELGREQLIAAYDAAIGPRTRLLVLPHVDNLVGLRQPVAQLAGLARRRGVEFVAVDGAQALGMLEIDVAASGVDFYAASPHKWLQAPKGLGLLYVREALLEALRPIWVSWGQQRWQGSARVFEDYGTRNLAEVLCLGDAIDFQAALDPDARQARYRALFQHALALADASPGLEWLSPREWSLASSVYSVGFPGRSAARVFDSLYPERGYVFRAFSQPGFDAGRLSLNLANSEDELDGFAEAVGDLPRS